MALLNKPSPVILSGAEIKQALAHHFYFNEDTIDSVHFLFKHEENDIGIILENKDIVTIEFLAYPGDAAVGTKASAIEGVTSSSP